MRPPKKIVVPISRSAIIYINSALGKFTAAGSLPFSASSMATSYLAMGLNYELKNSNVDVICMQSGDILGSSLHKSLTKAIPKSSIASYIRCSLTDLGFTSLTHGSLLDSFKINLALCLPLRFIQIILYSASLNNLARLRAKEMA